MSLDFYQDRLHPCAYLADRQARNIYPDPFKPVSNQLYSRLIQQGFRRSGEHIYRPFCPDCSACVPVRIKVNDFQPNRSQRRCLRDNARVSVQLKTPEFIQEHYDLYCRYIGERHAGGGMDNPTPHSFQQFLTSSWSDTVFIEFREDNRLLAVAVTDYIDNSASAFYTFFEPELNQRGLGTLAILRQIALLKQQRGEFLYLGYWIADSPKMNYKTRFSALQHFDRQWQNFDKKL